MAESVAKIGIGFVGARFAADLHAHALAPLRGHQCEFVAVCARTHESATAFAQKFGVPNVYTDYRAMLAREDVHAVSLAMVTSLHHEVAIAAAEAGKHIIMEKPLTGCFVDADALTRQRMWEHVLRQADAVLDACAKHKVTLCYAENFVYAPGVAKLRRLMDQSGGALLDLRAEESHSGSHAAYARRWASAGGGSFLRMGSHPVGAVIHLKHYEGMRKYGKPTRVKSIIADVERLTSLPVFRAQQKHYVKTDWVDVEDWSAAIMTFDDGTKATVTSTDISLGGVKNLLTAYLSNAVVQVNINPNSSLQLYAPESSIWGDEYICEKVETKAGWQFASPDEDWMRGYPQEMADFIGALREGREPLSGALLARDVVDVIYAGYVSAQEGRRVTLGALA